MKVNVKAFMQEYVNAPEYRHGIYVPEDVMFELDKCEFNDCEECEVPDNICEVIESARREEERRDKFYYDVSALRIAGMNAEEAEDVDGAVEHYAEAIELGENCGYKLLHAYHHAYNRIFVLLSRTRQYEREASYIERLLKHDELQDAERERLTARLEKTRQKIAKFRRV